MSQTPNWRAVSVSLKSPATDEAWEIFSALAFEEAGCLGLEGPALAGDMQTASLFFDGAIPHAKDVVADIARRVFGHGDAGVSEEMIPDKDWGTAWREFFHWRKVGDRTYVGPPWEQPPADAPAGAVLIRIEPAQAFGTGSHETTQLCLSMLESENLAGATVLDMGSGSGILAFGAVMLGAEFGLGVEYDPVCEENFHLNAELNDVKSRVEFVLGSAPSAGVEWLRAQGRGAPALALCNMLSERFTPLLGGLAALGCPLILSGFLLSESEAVEASCTAAGLRVQERRSLGEWGAYRCTHE